LDGVHDLLRILRKYRGPYYCKWGRELSYSKKLPVSIRETPLIHSLLIQYLDEILNNNMRQRFGARFPAFLNDLEIGEKDYFIQTLEQDSTLSEVFIPDVEQGAERLSISLKLWAGGITAAKATRKKNILSNSVGLILN